MEPSRGSWTDDDELPDFCSGHGLPGSPSLAAWLSGRAGRLSPTMMTRSHMFNLNPSPVHPVCCRCCSFWLGKLAQPHVPILIGQCRGT
jgi:hypothetical protein